MASEQAGTKAHASEPANVLDAECKVRYDPSPQFERFRYGYAIAEDIPTIEVNQEDERYSTHKTG